MSILSLMIYVANVILFIMVVALMLFLTLVLVYGIIKVIQKIREEF